MSHINAETELQKACALLDLVSGDVYIRFLCVVVITPLYVD